MKMSKPGVYIILNLLDNSRYVGSTPRRLTLRWSEHKCVLRKNKHGCPPLQKAWNEFGEDAFRFIVLENVTENHFEREQYWMDKFKNLGMTLYNRCPSAVNHKGLVMPYDAAQISSQKRTEARRNWSPERKQQYAEKMRQIANDPEMKKRNSEAVKQGWHDKNETKPPIKLQSPSGEIIEIHHLYNFCLDNGLDPSAITKVVKGKRPSHHGWRLAYTPNHLSK